MVMAGCKDGNPDIVDGSCNYVFLKMAIKYNESPFGKAIGERSVLTSPT